MQHLFFFFFTSMGISIKLIIRKDNYDDKKWGTTIRTRSRYFFNYLLCEIT